MSHGALINFTVEASNLVIKFRLEQDGLLVVTDFVSQCIFKCQQGPY